MTADLISFLHSGCSLLFGAATGSGAPFASRGWALEVDLDAGRARAVVSSADAERLEGPPLGSMVAVTGCDVRTLRSVQIKGTVVSVAPATADDERRVAAYCEEFFAAVFETDGVSRAHLERIVPTAFTALDLVIAQMFDQTPGPGAGATLPSGTA